MIIYVNYAQAGSHMCILEEAQCINVQEREWGFLYIYYYVKRYLKHIIPVANCIEFWATTLQKVGAAKCLY